MILKLATTEATDILQQGTLTKNFHHTYFGWSEDFVVSIHYKKGKCLTKIFFKIMLNEVLESCKSYISVDVKAKNLQL